MNTPGGIFTRDQQRWVTVRPDPKGPRSIVFTLAGPRATRYVEASEPMRTLGPSQGNRPLGLTRNGRIVASLARLPTASDIGLFEFGINPGAAPPRKWEIHHPTGARVDELALSRQGDRLAWLCFTGPTASLPILTPSIQSGHGNSRSTEELWLSNLDGSAMRRVGAIEIAPDRLPYADAYPMLAQWCPDGKRVSFIYQPTFKVPEALYVVAVE